MKGYKALAEVLDWGGHVLKIIVPMGGKVTALAAEDFAIDVEKVDPQTGKVAMVPIDWFSKETIPATGTLSVAKALLPYSRVSCRKWRSRKFMLMWKQWVSSSNLS